MKKLLLSIFCLFGIMGYAAAEEVTATISFADKSIRTELTTEKQVWKQNGITVTNNKGKSTTNVADYADPVRFYKNSELIVECAGKISKIVFHCDDNKNANPAYNKALSEAITSGGTVSVDGTDVIVVLSPASESFTIPALSVGQVRLDAITATFESDGTVTPEPEEPEQPGEGEGEEEEVEIEDIEVVLAAGVADKAKVQGTIVATYAKGFLLHDNTGDILVFLNNTHEYNVGNVVTVAGATSIYGGLLQFGSAPTVELVDNATVTEPTPVTIDGSGMDGYLEAPSIRYVVYTGKLTINGNYYNVAVEGATKTTASIQYPNTGLVPAEYNNGIIKVTGYLIGISGSKYVNTMATKVELIEEGEEEPEEPETPITGEILTVSQALAKYVEGEKVNVKVRGYIVGAMNSTGYVPEFGETGVYSNILLSENADEDNIDNCLIIQLVSGTDIRAKLNMGDNPGNYKKEVIIEGSLEKYFQQAGIKNPTAAQFTGTTAIENVETEAENAVIYDLTGRRIDEITEAGIYIINGVKKIVR